jgi:hypothetical protein
MDMVWNERASDSPLVARIWHSRSEEATPFTSIASTHWEMVVTRCRGQTTLTVRGPETRATPAVAPPDAEFVGVQFKRGTLIPLFPANTILDRQDVTLPALSPQTFCLDGSVWELPTFENADTFVSRLVRQGLLIYDPLVADVLHGKRPALSLRTVQRRILKATGLTQATIFQIERARYATQLLTEGVAILDAVEQAGYFDQPHLTRALRHYIGFTPAHLISPVRDKPLSFLYKTQPLVLSYDSSA